MQGFILQQKRCVQRVPADIEYLPEIIFGCGLITKRQGERDI